MKWNQKAVLLLGLAAYLFLASTIQIGRLLDPFGDDRVGAGCRVDCGSAARILGKYDGGSE